MGGFFGVAKHDECINELFYGVDYNSHMGTKRAGIATCYGGVFTRSSTILKIPISDPSLKAI